MLQIRSQSSLVKALSMTASYSFERYDLVEFKVLIDDVTELDQLINLQKQCD